LLRERHHSETGRIVGCLGCKVDSLRP
jgi:hypothetical protein